MERMTGHKEEYGKEERKIEKGRGVSKIADEEKEMEENTNAQSLFQGPCVVTCL